jgi:phage-related protein
MANEITIKIGAHDDASAVIGGVAKKAGGLGSALSGVAKIAGGFVVAQGVMKLGGFLMDAANAAAEDEAATLRLQKAVENTGASYDAFAPKIEAAITGAQKLAFSDDDARASLSLLMAQTGDADEAMRRLSLGMDVARGAGIPLEQASKLLGKVTAENVNVFKKMGITLAEGATEAEAFAALQGKFAGQADTFANSTAGQMEKAKIQMGELKEKIGYAVIPIMAKVASFVSGTIIPAFMKLADVALKPVKELFGMVGEAIKTVQFYLGGLTGAFKEGDVTSDGFFGKMEQLGVILRQVADWVKADLIPALQTLGPWFIDLGKTMFEMGKGIAEFLAPSLDTLADLWANVLQPALIAIMPYLKQVWEFLSAHKEIIIVAAAAILLLTNPWLAVAAAIAVVLAKWDAISKFFTVDVPGAIDKFLDKIGEIPIIGEIFKTVWKDVEVITHAFWDGIKIYVETAIKVVKDVIKIVTALIHGDWKTAWEGIKQLFTDVWDGIIGLVGVYLDTIKGLFENRLALVTGLWGDFWEGLTAGASLLATQIATFGTTAFAWFLSLPSKFLALGADMIIALWNGITSIDIVGLVKGLGRDIWSGFTGALGDLMPGSPSRLGIGVGSALGEGIQVGFEAHMPALKNMLAAWANYVREQMGLPALTPGAAAAWGRTAEGRPSDERLLGWYQKWYDAQVEARAAIEGTTAAVGGVTAEVLAARAAHHADLVAIDAATRLLPALAGGTISALGTGLGGINASLKDIAAYYLEAIRNRLSMVWDALTALPSYLSDIVNAINNISIPSAQHGAAVLASGLANVHAGEVIGSPGALMGVGGGGGTHIHMHVQGSILSERDLERVIADAFRHGKFRGMPA